MLRAHSANRPAPGRRTRAVEERLVDAGRGIELCYSELGNRDDPAVLLVMGLGLSLDWWRDDFCAALVDEGLRVIRFDNRDVGRSTHVHGRGIGPLGFLTRRANPVYTLGDMADDAAGLLAAVCPGGAHVVGASLGAMVAQEIAIRHPGRTLSLTSIMGRPGDRRTGRVSWRRTPDFLRAPGPDPVEDMVATFRRIGSRSRTAVDDEDVRITVRRAAARETRPAGDGSGRQLASCVAERDRTADLRRLDVPTLVVHGTDDLVIKPDGGRATAAAIPGARLLEIDGMGHDLARASWPPIVEAISGLVSRTRA